MRIRHKQGIDLPLPLYHEASQTLLTLIHCLTQAQGNIPSLPRTSSLKINCFQVWRWSLGIASSTLNSFGCASLTCVVYVYHDMKRTESREKCRLSILILTYVPHKVLLSQILASSALIVVWAQYLTQMACCQMSPMYPTGVCGFFPTKNLFKQILQWRTPQTLIRSKPLLTAWPVPTDFESEFLSSRLICSTRVSSHHSSWDFL